MRGSIRVYNRRTTGGFEGEEYPPRKRGLRPPEKFLKCRYKIFSFEATLRLSNHFCADNVGKDLWVAFIHTLGLGLPQCHPSVYLTKNISSTS